MGMWKGMMSRKFRRENIEVETTCNSLVLKNLLINQPLLQYLKYKERICKSTHTNLGFIEMIYKLIIGITYR